MSPRNFVPDRAAIWARLRYGICYLEGVPVVAPIFFPFFNSLGFSPGAPVEEMLRSITSERLREIMDEDGMHTKTNPRTHTHTLSFSSGDQHNYIIF